MSKDPAVLFYTSDFITGTLTMTNEHVGMYIRLLCLQHQKGYLVKTDLLYICTTYVKEVFDKFYEKDGKFYNIRMKTESEKRKKYSDSRRENINKRYKKNKPTYVEHMENENENIINNNRGVIGGGKKTKGRDTRTPWLKDLMEKGIKK